MRGLDDLVAAGKVHARRSPLRHPRLGRGGGRHLTGLRGWSPPVALQVEYSLLERTAERELLPMAEAFGLAVTAWAPMGAGVLTGKYARGPSTTPADLAAAARPPTRARLTEDATLRIARAVDQVADELGRPRPRCMAWVPASHPRGRDPHHGAAPRRARVPGAGCRPSTGPAWTR